MVNTLSYNRVIGEIKSPRKSILLKYSKIAIKKIFKEISVSIILTQLAFIFYVFDPQLPTRIIFFGLMTFLPHPRTTRFFRDQQRHEGTRSM